ncbi:rubredoxin [Burkholderia sp. KCJ3K979]|nr:rubredoxin [Burkholderia sp. KCJ3K979]
METNMSAEVREVTTEIADSKSQADFRIWQCALCGFIYDEAEGLPSEGIAPGTRWEDVPDDWVCPECSVGKADFDMVEV